MSLFRWIMLPLDIVVSIVMLYILWNILKGKMPFSIFPFLWATMKVVSQIMLMYS